MAASGAARLKLGNPLKDAACSVLSILKLCSDNKNLEKDISTLSARENFFAEAMKTDQAANDRKFFLLGSNTQENVKAVRDFVQNCLTATARAVDQLTHALNYFAHCVVHTIHISNLVFEVEIYILILDLVYTHLEPYRADFFSYRISL